ncbi:hypothetical protein OESDEN_06703, partial [Oesophagostomum dentatum]
MRLAFYLLPLLPQIDAFTMASSIGGEYEVSRNIMMKLESRMTCLYETLQQHMILHLTLGSAPGSTTLLSMRLTSPSGAFSEWMSGQYDVDMVHNVTENG